MATQATHSDILPLVDSQVRPGEVRGHGEGNHRGLPAHDLPLHGDPWHENTQEEEDDSKRQHGTNVPDQAPALLQLVNRPRPRSCRPFLDHHLNQPT